MAEQVAKPAGLDNLNCEVASWNALGTVAQIKSFMNAQICRHVQGKHKSLTLFPPHVTLRHQAMPAFSPLVILSLPENIFEK